MSWAFEWLSSLVARRNPSMAPADGARLQRVGRDCWVADRELTYGARGTLPLRMVVLRGPQRALTLYSPVQLDEGTQEALAGLGDVTRIVAPNRFHRLFVDEAMARYPAAQLLLSEVNGGLLERYPDRALVVDGPLELDDGLDLLPVHLRDSLIEIVLYHDPSETLVVADLLFNIRQAASRTARFFHRLNGVWGRPAQSRIQRWILLRNRDSLSGFYRWAMAKPFVRIALAHGQLISVDAREQFYQIFKGYGR